ncbi:hypothetical protein AGMMS50268_22540 [Spirochaetia bacterium]|nr:hypothetical protein AGMMS50268_22540 [Spirochaetia bacterium]
MKKIINLELAKPFYELALKNRRYSLVTKELCTDGIKLRITMNGEGLALKAVDMFGELCHKVKPFMSPLYRQPTPDTKTGVYLEVTPVQFVFCTFKHGMESVSELGELELR